MSKLKSVRNLPGSPAVAHVSRSAMGWWVRGGRGCGPARDWRLRLGNMGTQDSVVPPPPPRQHAPAQPRHSDVTNTRRYTKVWLPFEYQHSEKAATVAISSSKRFCKDLCLTDVFKQLWDTSTQKRQ